MPNETPQEQLARSTQEVNQAIADQRKAAGEVTKKLGEESRQASERTLREQSEQKPDPSQDVADAILTGSHDSAQAEPVEQPKEGPAAKAEEDRAGANQRALEAVSPAGGYQTRSVEAPRGPGRPPKAAEPPKVEPPKGEEPKK